MKNIIIIGGRSKNNIPWIENMQTEYRKDYNVSILYYDHWKIEDADMNFDLELDKLSNIIKQYKEYVIVAKSAGILLSLFGVNRGLIKPRLIITMGIPLKYANESNIDVKELFSKAKGKSKILVIQKRNDPQGSAQEIRKLLPKSISLIEIDGDDHTYNEISSIKKDIDEFIR